MDSKVVASIGIILGITIAAVCGGYWLCLQRNRDLELLRESSIVIAESRVRDEVDELKAALKDMKSQEKKLISNVRMQCDRHIFMLKTHDDQIEKLDTSLRMLALAIDNLNSRVNSHVDK